MWRSEKLKSWQTLEQFGQLATISFQVHNTQVQLFHHSSKDRRDTHIILADRQYELIGMPIQVDVRAVVQVRNPHRVPVARNQAKVVDVALLKRGLRSPEVCGQVFEKEPDDDNQYLCG
jgi:hypothetical protein